MDSQEILESISNLEQKFQRIETARQQIEHTVKAYEGTRTQLVKLTQEMSSVSLDIQKRLEESVKRLIFEQENSNYHFTSKLEESVNNFVSIMGHTAYDMNGILGQYNNFLRDFSLKLDTAMETTHKQIMDLSSKVEYMNENECEQFRKLQETVSTLTIANGKSYKLIVVLIIGIIISIILNIVALVQ